MLTLSSTPFTTWSKCLSASTTTTLLITAGVGLSFVLTTISPNKINSFESVLVRSHGDEIHDKVTVGRVCSNCQIFHEWDKFDRKPNGVNGRNSRCKKCDHSLRRKVYRQSQPKERSNRVMTIVETFESYSTDTSVPATELRGLLFDLVIDSITSDSSGAHRNG